MLPIGLSCGVCDMRPVTEILALAMDTSHVYSVTQLKHWQLDAKGSCKKLPWEHSPTTGPKHSCESLHPLPISYQNVKRKKRKSISNIMILNFLGCTLRKRDIYGKKTEEEG